MPPEKILAPTARRKLLLAAALGIFFAVFLCYPLGSLLAKGVLLDGWPSLYAFRTLFSSPLETRMLVNSLFLAMTVTVIASAIAVPISLVVQRREFPLRRVAAALILLPLVLPPFVGALGFRQLFGRFGTVNLLLLDTGIIRHPIPFLGGGTMTGVVVMQVLHLAPILYLTLSASVVGLNRSLEEAAATLGATPCTILRRVVLPLLLPGYLAGATLVFIASLTDLGTPLLIEYREVIPVRLFEMVNDPNEGGEGYALIILLCAVVLVLFFATARLVPENLFEASARGKSSTDRRPLHGALGFATGLCLIIYGLIGVLPHVAVIMMGLSKEWFLTAIPTAWTTEHFHEVLTHPLTVRGILNSLGLATAATVLSGVLGFSIALLRSRGRVPGSPALHLLAMTPAAVPGILFAFGYARGFSGTILDNRLNPLPLLLIAYAVRRLPQMSRAADAGFRESSRELENAAATLGASPSVVTRRITLPLMKDHLLAGAVLTFSYCMLEVSDSLILALEERFYPMSKVMYALISRPDGTEMASALGVVSMVILGFCFWLSQRVTRGIARSDGASATICVLLVVGALLLSAPIAAADGPDDELVALSPHWEGIRREFERAFAERYHADTGRRVHVRWLDVGGTSEILKFIRGGFRDHDSGIGVDVLFGGGTDPYLDLVRDGKLEPVDLPEDILDGIPADLGGQQLYDPQRRWFGAALSVFGIIDSKQIVDRAGLPAVRDWRDLANPKLFNWVSNGDPRRSGSVHFVVETILQAYGWDDGWRVLAELSANCTGLTTGSMEVGKNVSIGEAAYGPLIDSSAGEIVRSVGRERVDYILPRGLTVVSADGVAVIKGAPHRDIADRFVRFVLSREGQLLWWAKPGTPGGPVRSLGKLPIRPEVYELAESDSVIHDNPFKWTFSFRYDPSLGSKRWRVVNELFGVFITETLRPLRVAQQARRDGAGDETAFTMPVTEQEAGRVAGDKTLENPLARATILKEWRKQSWSRFPPEARRIPPLMLVPLLLFGGALGWGVLRASGKHRPDA